MCGVGKRGSLPPIADTISTSPHTSFVGKPPFKMFPQDEIFISGSDILPDKTLIKDHNRLFSASELKETAPPRSWTAEGYLPKGVVTGLMGPGGAGKSLIGQQLGTSLSVGQPWLGIETQAQRVLAYFCEDDRTELWRRQNSINKAMVLNGDEVGDFSMQSRIGMDNILMKFSGGIGERTDFFYQLENDIEAYKAETIILDNIAQMFGGNENIRGEVTQFVNALHGLIGSSEKTILMLGHPPKPSAGIQQEYSGSTAWDACFRSRLFFGRPEKTEDDDGGDYRILSKKKANYSSIGDFIKVRWEEGFFSPSNPNYGAVERMQINAHQNSATHAFLKMLDILNERGQEVTHSPQSSSFAPKVMAAMSYAKEHKISMGTLKTVMNLLLDEKAIILNADLGKRGGRPVVGIKRAVK